MSSPTNSYLAKASKAVLLATDEHTDPPYDSWESWIVPPPGPPLPPAIKRPVDPAPSKRMNNDRRFFYGLVNGAIVIDMTEDLRYHTRATDIDKELSFWLERNFIVPYRRIERQDALHVRHPDEMETLVFAHKRYTMLKPLPNGLPPERLFVRDFEPLYEPKSTKITVPEIPDTFERTNVFIPSNMWKKNVVKRGIYAGKLLDGNGWERQVWSRWEWSNSKKQESIVADMDLAVRSRGLGKNGKQAVVCIELEPSTEIKEEGEEL